MFHWTADASCISGVVAFAEELEPVRQMVRYWFGKIFKPAKKQIKVELPK